MTVTKQHPTNMETYRRKINNLKPSLILLEESLSSLMPTGLVKTIRLTSMGDDILVAAEVEKKPFILTLTNDPSKRVEIINSIITFHAQNPEELILIITPNMAKSQAYALAIVVL